MEAWLLPVLTAVISGASGVFGAWLGARSALKGQSNAEKAQMRREASRTLGKLRRLIEDCVPARFEVPVRDVEIGEHITSRLRSVEERWYDLSADLFGIHVLAPETGPAVDSIYVEMTSLSTGLWLLTRRSFRGDDTDRLLARLDSQRDLIKQALSDLVKALA